MGKTIRVLGVACALAVLADCTGDTPRAAAAPAPAPRPAFDHRLLEFAPPFFPADSGGSRYARRDSKGRAEFTRDGMSLTLRGAEAVIRWGLVGARAVEPRAEGPLEGRLNFFVGEPSRWRTDVPTSSRLVYEGVYPGIDLVLESRPQGVEYSLVAAPGADLRPVRFRYQGVAVTAREDGRGLELRGAGATLREEGLLCYQPDGERRRTVAARYTRVRQTADGAEYGVQLDRHDASAPLVIDPQILWGSYVGASGWDVPLAIAVDANHNVYLAGHTEPPGFLGASPLDGTLDGQRDGYVMKVHPSGSSLLWATYLGGSGDYDSVEGMALDSGGNAYVVGYTSSTDFPVTGGFDTVIGGFSDAFITKISASGSSLLWSSYLGGTDNNDFARDVATDAAGNAYVVGDTQSSDFPTTGGFDTSFGGYYDGFVTKVSAAGALVWSSYLGSPGALSEDSAYSVAVDGSSNVYVAGYTKSSSFPTTGGFDTTYGGGVRDAFMTKVNAAGSSLAWSTYMGGAGFEEPPYALVADSTGVYGILTTSSPDIPIVGGFNSIVQGEDTYVFKIAADGSGLAWSTFLGGSDNDASSGIALDPSGNVYVAGSTYSTDFPTPGGFDSTQSHGDAFVALIRKDGSKLLWASLMGGSSLESARDIAVDDAGNL